MWGESFSRGDDETWRAQPLPITAVLLTHAQEAYAAEALASVLAQDYPMQVIASDDASSDASHEVLCAVARAHDGPHRVIVGRSRERLGLARHLSVCVARAEGELILGCDGDDVSLPGRVAAIAAEFRARPRLQLYASGWIDIDPSGRELGQSRVQPWVGDGAALGDGEQATVLGATIAFRRALIDRFGAIDSAVHGQDAVLVWRAALLGELKVDPEPRVRYRHAPGGMSRNRDLAPPTNVAAARRQCAELATIHAALIDDLEQACRTLGHALPPPLAAVVRARLGRLRFELHAQRWIAQRPPWTWIGLQAYPGGTWHSRRAYLRCALLGLGARLFGRNR